MLLGSGYPCALEAVGGNGCFGLGNIAKAMIPMVNGRYICFHFMFLYSLFPGSFYQLAQMWARRGRETDGVKNSIVKHLKWNLVITQATTPTSPLSPGGPQKKQQYPSFPPHQWDEVFRKKSSVLQIPAVCSSPSSPRPHSQCLSQCGLAGLDPKLKRTPPPSLLTHRTLPFLPLHHQKHTNTSFSCLLVL